MSARRSKEDLLLDSVMDALADMVDLTCADMLPLWLRASRSVRASLCKTRTMEVPPYPLRLQAVQRPTKSKYMALAGWRHCVVWLRLLEEPCLFDAPQDLECMRLTYFQPCVNEQPYSYSQRTSVTPDMPRGLTVSEVRTSARGACMSSISALREEYQRQQNRRDQERMDFVLLGLKDSLRDVLKLPDDFDVRVEDVYEEQR